jgi:hypothetical protein
MKKSTLLTTFLAAGMISGTTWAQAPKYVLFEHFTQASCGPCAAQNPAFETNILQANPGTVRHIAYHTSWPGVDPMYNYNSTEVNTRTSFYNVTGVPFVALLGNQKTGNPGAFTQGDIDEQFAMGSPIKIVVSEVDNGTTRTVTVDVKTVGTVPTGSYTIRTAVVEDPINYSSPPGSNGETHFPNVFRKMLPNIAGDAITPAAVGSSVTFTYTYNEDPAWNLANIKVIAFVQNNSTKEVINVGSTFDPVINYTLSSPAAQVQAGSPAGTTSFSLTSSNTGNASEQFTYTLTSTAPANWNANFMIGSATYTSTATVSVNAGASNSIAVNVMPGSTPAVGEFTLTVASVSNPSSPVMKKTVYVISGVTDLIVNGSGYIGDATTPGDASNFQNVYVAGLQSAGNTTYATTSDKVTARAIQDNALNGVKNIYYNVAWTFPAFNDNLVAQLTTFLSNGGKMFISGQDIGWDVWDVANGGNGTAAQQSFYTNYMGANYSADGGTGNTQLTTVTTDNVWGTMPNATISNTVYGASYFFPDELTASSVGTPIYKYNATAKIAGVRAVNWNMGWKTVYIAPGMEMLGATESSAIIKLAHDWFYGLVSTEEFDKSMLMLGQNYPNPATGVTYIPVVNAEEDMTLEVIDLTGRVISSQQVIKGTEVVEVNTSNLVSGMYMYRLLNETGVSAARPMQVIR